MSSSGASCCPQAWCCWYCRQTFPLLVATIGASARFSHVADNLPLLAVGALWMLFHPLQLSG